MRTAACVFTLAVMVAAPSVAQDYGRLMEQKVRSALGKDSTKGYKFASYPVDNFGLATLFDSANNTQICATWTCIAEDDDVPPDTDVDAQLRLITLKKKRFADKGTGGKIDLTSDEKKNLGLTAVLPQLMKVIGVNADFSSDKDIDVDLALGPVTIRHLIKDRLIERINSLPSAASAKDAFQNKRLIVVYSDIVASKMNITISFDGQKKADLDAKLSGPLGGKVGEVIGGKDTELKVKVNSAQKGKYVLEVARPVILATYTKKQPATGKLGAADFSRWPDADVPSPIFKKVQ